MNEQTNNGNSRSLTIRHDEINTRLSSLNLLDEKQLSQAEFFLKKILTSDKSGLKSVQDGLAIMMRAQDLNMPFSTAIEHIHVINGKTGIDIHIAKSLLSRAGVTWKTTKDYTPLYQYTDGNTIYNQAQLPDYCVICRNEKEAESKSIDDTIGVYPLKYYQDLKGNIFSEFEISSKCVKCINKIQALKVAQEGNYPVIRIPSTPIDYVTEYEFTRYRNINGKEVLTHTTSHFSYTEAATAELFTKDTYKKYARILISHRAWMLGARDIASDILMGCMSTDELDLVVGNTNPSSDYFEEVDIEEVQQ